jgi:Fur family ferric uptake transcriptional regulator
MIGEPDTQKLSENERLLMRKGVRITKYRLLILERLQQSCTQHFSAEELYRLLVSNGRKVEHAGIHRGLTEFCAAGIAVKHRFLPTGRFTNYRHKTTTIIWLILYGKFSTTTAMS